MFHVYAFASPNAVKVPIALEEMGLPYQLHTVNTRLGEQKQPAFLALNPNAKIPVLVDASAAAGGDFTLTESAAILVYLAEQSGQLLPRDGADRARVFEQLFFHASALSPAFGQAGFFQKLATEQMPLAIARFQGEAQRVMGVLDACWPSASTWPARTTRSPTSPTSAGCGAAPSPASTSMPRPTSSAGTSTSPSGRP